MIEFDETLFLNLNQALSGPVASVFFSIITYLGDGLILALLILPLLYRFDRSRFRFHAVGLVLAVAVSGLVINLMKIAVDRPRPPAHFAASGIEVHAPLGEPHDRSFPSGHTQTAFGAAVYLTCMFPLGGAFFLGLACLVGLSRIAIGVHFPLDVLTGAFIGSVFSIVSFYITSARLRIRNSTL